jgi:hypothetical protein
LLLAPIFLTIGAAAGTGAGLAGGLPKPPWADPKNYTLNLPVKTQVGPICPGGKTGGSGCHYVPLGGATLTVRSMSGKLIRIAHTAANGRGVVRLPKGRSKLTFSHAPYDGHPLGTKTYTIKAPVYQPPPSYFLFTFCLVQDC